VAIQEPDEAEPQAWRGRRPARPLRFSLYFFSDDGSREAGAKYRLALESARFADANGFDAVWTPERHFQPFGGLYPNPSVLSAALAAITSRVGIRAGSVALPLHHPVRVAEEWSVVDNLSGGRVAVSFASGWHPDDFVLTPSPYDDRKEVMFRGIETIRRLWAGETITLEGPEERQVEVRTLPRPIQPALPVWITTAGNPETWERAGSVGANVLAALVGYTLEDLSALVGKYRLARQSAGHDPAAGIVTVVVPHLRRDERRRGTRAGARADDPLPEDVSQAVPEAGAGGGPGHRARRARRGGAGLRSLFRLEHAAGNPEQVRARPGGGRRRRANEMACLIDFGLDPDTVLAALPRLAELREHFSAAAVARGEPDHDNAS
jgi:natural product biosynthesis luciferase-like monooxygenase protein